MQLLPRALVVVYPRSACSGSASAVLVDEHGRFLGAVVPGGAALLNIPSGLGTITAFSSVEVTAPAGSWFATERVAVPPLPAGLILRSTRSSARHCNNGQYFGVEVASKEELQRELGESEVRWFEADQQRGQAWLDEHGARVDDMLGPAVKRRSVTMSEVVIR